MKRIAIFLWAALTTSAAFSQTDTVQLLPVEVKSIRASATAPFAKTNISRKEIEKQNLGQDLPFMLNQTPNVVVNSDAGTGVGYTGIRIRGTDATRINVTINGIPFNDAESGGTFFVNMPDIISSVNSIQVQRGVGTSTNGAGAFGASINLSTNEVNKEAYAEFNNSYGSFNTWKNTIRAGTGLLNGRFTADLRLSQIQSDGYIDRAWSDLKSFYFSTAYLRENTSVRLNIFSGREHTYQAWNGVPEAQLRTNRTMNTAGTEKSGEPYENETDNYTQTHYQLFLNQKLSQNWIFNTGLFYVKGAGYYEQYKANQRYSRYALPNMNYNGTSVPRTDLVRQLWLDNDFYGNIFSFLHQTQKREITVGGAVTRYLGNHFGNVIWAANGLPTPTHRYYENDAYKGDWNVYTKWQEKLNQNFQSFIDLQVRRVQHSISGFRNTPQLAVEQSWLFFNPKAGITYSNNNWVAYSSIAVANKEPNRRDLEAGFTQIPRAERLYNLETGVERRTSRYSWSANFYFMKYKDQLVLTGQINDVGAYTRTNIDDSYRMGIELQGGVVMNRFIQVTGNVAFSRNKVLNFKEYIDNYDAGGQKIIEHKETDISFSPSVVGAATITITPVQNFSVELLSKYVGEQYLDNTQNENRKLNAFYTQDVRMIYNFSKRWMKNVSLIAQVNNVFNTMYEPNGYTFRYFVNNQMVTENFYYPMAGINWMVGVNVRL